MSIIANSCLEIIPYRRPSVIQKRMLLKKDSEAEDLLKRIKYCLLGANKSFINFLPSRERSIRDFAASIGVDVVRDISVMSEAFAQLDMGDSISLVQKNLIRIQEYRAGYINNDIKILSAYYGISIEEAQEKVEGQLIVNYWKTIHAHPKGRELLLMITQEWKQFALDNIVQIDRGDVLDPDIDCIIKNAENFYNFCFTRICNRYKSDFMREIDLYNSSEVGKIVKAYGILQLKLVGVPMLNLWVTKVLREVARTMFRWGYVAEFTKIIWCIKNPTIYESSIYRTYDIRINDNGLFIKG